MIIKRTHVLAAVIWLLSLVSVFGQVGFSLPSFTNTAAGQQLDVPVTVVNFDTVFSIQYVLQWNPAVLEFQSITKPNNPLGIVDSACFNLTEAAAGQIRFRWYSTFPRTLIDGADLFHMNLKVIGANGTSSSIIFTEIIPITYFEVVRGPGNQFFNLSQALITNGSVGVGMPSSVDAPSGQTIKTAVAPNPFSDFTRIQFELTQRGSVRLMLTDVAGKICYETNEILDRGQHEKVVLSSNLPAKGMYYVHLFSADAHTVRAIVAQ